MNKMVKKVVSRIACCLISIFSVTSVITPINVSATAVDPIIVVSLGDSYSSGEGIEPFYGQYDANGNNYSISEKITNEDWVAHRSTKSWPSLLEIPGVENKLGNYKDKTDTVQWYFKAASGATTEHFLKEQEKTIIVPGRYTSYVLDSQLSVFDDIEYGTVDYVTLTLGGNDVDFTGIVVEAATLSSYLTLFRLTDKLGDSWDKFNESVQYNLEKTYRKIQKKAGSQANIIVAGYPKLISEAMEVTSNFNVFNTLEAFTINKNVQAFNSRIEKIVNDCRKDGLNITFVDVEEAFDGHEAYSAFQEPYLNGVILGAKSEDIDQTSMTSSYSLHPNENGAQAYAKCVNEAIEKIEKENHTSTLSGTVQAEDGTGIRGASVQVINSDATYGTTVETDENGSFTINLPPDTYALIVTADGYERVAEKDFLVTRGDNLVSVTLKGGSSSYYGKDIFQMSDWTIGGKAINECTAEDIYVAYSIDEADLQTSSSDSDYQWYDGALDTTNKNNLEVHPAYGYSDLSVEYSSGENCSTVYQPGFRDLQMGDSYTTVLEKLGFSEYGISEITEYFEGVREAIEDEGKGYVDLEFDNWSFHVESIMDSGAGTATGYTVWAYAITYHEDFSDSIKTITWDFDANESLYTVDFY